MTLMVPIALIGWIPLALAMFLLLPTRAAVLACFIGGWLFLPIWGYDIPALPDYTKTSAMTLGALLGVLLTDLGQILTFRPRLMDLPMAIWCVVPLFSSLSNDLGVYDGMATSFGTFTTWGVPYFLGRIYLTDLASLRTAAIAILIGGLIYVPLCLFEIRMSPQLHRWVYGFHAMAFQMTRRFGGYRPTVFMQSGLMVGMWMTSASLVGVWLWRSGALRRLGDVPSGWLVIPLLLTTVLCKSLNALLLLAAGLVVFFLTKWLRSRVFLLALVAVPPMYMLLRIDGIISGKTLVAQVQNIFGRERAESLQTRIINETMLAEKAMQRPAFGWGEWGRSRVRNREGKDISITDGMWIIVLGAHGLVGLIAVSAVLLLPVIALPRRLPVQYWAHPVGAAAAALATLVALHMIDNIPNGMFNPIYVLAEGG